MSAITIIVLVALAKVALALLATTRGGRETSSLPSQQEDEEQEFFRLACGPDEIDSYPTGNLASEEYSSAAGSRQAFGDIRDPDEYYHHEEIEHIETGSMFDDSSQS